MPGDSNGDLYENKLERVWSEIRRIDQLRLADAKAQEDLNREQILRLDQRMNGQEVAVAAALAAAEKAVAAALVASEKAVNKAETAQQKVNETQNEFRGQLKDQAQLFMPRTEAENTFRELRTLISTQQLAGQELRSRIDVGPPSLSALQRESDQGRGRRDQTIDSRSLMFAVLGAIGVIGGIVALVISFGH